MSKLTVIRLVLVVFLLASFLSPAQPVFADKANVCGAPGKDGPATALSGVINSYYPGTGNVAVGATSIPVGSARAGGGPEIAAGDLLLIVQVQGAEINATNTNNYGDGVGNGNTNVNTVVYSGANNYAGGHLATNFYAGNYEYVVAAGPVAAGAVPLATPTTIAFYNADFGAQGQRRFQVIRVPQYSSVTLGGTLTAPAWDGTTGGFVVLDVAGQLNWNGNAINASGIGFRGGAGRQLGGDAGNWWDFRTPATDTANGSKGEGYAGTPRYVFFNNALVDTLVEGYPNGSNGRGAAGNGGGGSTDGNPTANDQNSGGGGGGNGGYGGMGGNSWSSGRVNGGYGGAPFPGSAPRLILGGGGGAGTTNDGTGTPANGLASSGAAGGGVVFVRAGTITGTGTINAGGANALNTVQNDGGGGGGAGGSVVVIARNGGGAVGVLTVNAQGGTGGSTWTGQPRGTGGINRHGPGGGGGGGFVYTSAALAASNVTGGANGVTTTGSEDFGATDGGPGTLVTNATPASIPPAISGAGCTTITPAVTKTTSTPTIVQTATGVTGTYTITVSVPTNSAWASGVVISDTLPTPPTGTITYAATTNVVLTGTGTTRSTTTNPTAGTVTPSWGTFDIAPGGSVAITFTVNFSAAVPAGTYQNPAQATYLNPTRTVSTDAIAVTYASGSSTAEDITLTASADLQITKTDGVTNVRTGDTLTYSVVVTNRGPAAANNSVFTDPAVAGLNVTGVTCGSATAGAVCPAPAATTVALMRGAGIVIPTLPSNSSVTFTITATVTAVSGSLANVANIAPPAGLPDPGVYPNSATDTDTVVSNPQIALAKTPANQMVVSGSNVSFTLTVTNPGDVPLNTVNLTDAQCTTGPTRVSGDTNSNNILETSETWVYSCTINNATADFTNNASVSGVAPSGTTVNAAASATVDVIHPAILLDKTPATQSVVYGSPANFTLTVTNPGDVALSSVVLTDAQCTTGPTRVSGDTNSNNILETSETWVYSCQIANITANLTNSASVSAAAPAGPAVTSADTANVTMTLSPAITLEKTGTLDLTVVPPAGTANVGDRITYTFTVRNTGNVPLTNVTVADTVGGVTISGGPLASLAVGASDSTTFTGTYTLTQANINVGSFTNTATASGTPPVGAAVTGADNDTQTLTPAPAISLVKTGTLDLTVIAPAASANVGDVINYAFTVTNTGNVTLSNITLADTMGGVTVSGGPLASLNPGQSDTTTFTGAYTLTQADIDAGSFANTATVTGTPPAGANVSSPDSETTTIPQDARLSITKSATSAGPYSPGSTITYDIVATNTGNTTLSGVTVTDPGTGAVLGACTPSTPASLAPGASVTCAATHVVTQSDLDTGSYANTAEADSDQTARVTDSETVTFVQSPALSVTKSATSSGPYAVGDTVSYDIVATNTGNITLSGVTVTDPGTGAVLGACTPAIPASLAPNATVTCAATHVVTQTDLDAGSYLNTATADSDQTSPVTDDETVTFTQSPALSVTKSVTSSGPYAVGDTISYDIVANNTGNITLNAVTITDSSAVVGTCAPALPATLAPGASVTCEATHVVTQTDLDNGSYLNTATADSDETAAVTDGETVTFVQSPTLAVTKSVTSSGPYAVGDTISYDIVATNAGNITLTNVTLSDSSATLGSCTPAIPASLAPGASVTCEATHVVTQTDLDNGSYLNTATADSDETAAVTDGETVTFTQSPALVVTKSVTSSGPYGVGDTISYDILATNTGNITLHNVTVTDPGTDVTLGACTPAIPASLAPGAAVTCAATHVITQTDIDAGSYLNTATADSDQTSPISDDETVTFTQSPALAVVKSVTSSGPYAVGDTLTYDIVATNTGNITLSGITVTDPGTGATLGACTPSIPASLAPGASVTCAATHVVTQGDLDMGSYANTAEADSDQTAPVTDSETVTFTQSPALNVTKSVTSSGPYAVGDTLTYDIVATNTGNVTLAGVTITDPGTGATLGACAPAIPVSLAPGASVTCAATHVVTQGNIDAGSYVNIASADSDATSPVTDAETVTFSQSPALAVTKTVTSSDPYAVGDTVTYDIVATNTGNVTLNAVTITDSSAVLGTCTPALPATLAPAASVTCAATHVVTQTDLDNGSYLNTATADADETAPVTDSETVTFVQSPALAVIKSVTSSGPYSVGDSLTYDIVATNTGNITLTNVTVTDPGTGAVLGACTPAIPASLAPNASVTCAATHVVTQTDLDAGSYLNTATADSDETAPASDDETVTFTQSPALAVVKTATSSGPYAVGDTVSYDIVATNTGNITLTGVSITDPGTGAVLGACSPAVPATLAPTASVTCAATHVVTQTDLDAGSYLNTATADSDQTSPVSDNETVAFTQSPALAVTKTVTSSGPYAVGDTISYDIVATNTGNITLNAVAISDSSAVVGTCAPALPATLAPGASVTCAATHVVTQTDLDAGSYLNTATADADETAAVTDSETVSFVQSPALAVVKSVTSSGPYAVGDTVTYDITATNTGNITLTGVSITDPGTDVTLGACTPAVPATLAPNASVSCAATHVVSQADLDAGSFVNLAAADSDQTAAVTDSETVNFAQSPALAVAKSVSSSGPYALGDTVTYTIVARNTGNITLSGVTVTDPGTDVTLGTCTPAIPASLAPGATVTCSAAHTVTQANIDAGSFLNVATADSDQTSAVTDDASVTFTQSPALAVTKTVTSSGPYALGDTVSYDIVATNTGNITLTGVSITDAGTDVTLGACSPAIPASLTPGAAVTCAATHVVTQADLDAGSFLNIASADSDQTDAVTDSETVTFVQSPALETTKTATSSGPYAVGDTVSYDIVVRNSGNITLSGVTVTDAGLGAVLGACSPAIPASLAPGASVTCAATHVVSQTDLDAGVYVNFATGDSDQTSIDLDSESVAFTQSPALAVTKTATSSGPYAVGDTLTYAITATNTGNVTLANVTVTDPGTGAVLGACTPAIPATLAPGAAVTCEATHVVTQIDLDAGSYLNTATADSDGTAAVSDDETVTFLQSPALAVVKTATSSGPYAVGDTLTYDIVATNTGNITLTGVTVTDPGTGAVLGACTPAIPASLAPNASVTCAATHVVTQTDLDAGSYLNTATADSDETAPVSEDETVNFVQNPALSVTKSVTSGGPYAVGDTISYDIVARNTGNITLDNVTVTDPGTDVTLGACSPAIPASLAPNATVTCAATHVVTQTDLDAGSYLNTATADSDQTSPVTDGETVTFVQSPALAVVKSVTSSGPYAAGDTLTYDIVATNTGNVTLNAVTITDSSAVVGSCTPALPAMLTPGASVTCAATHVVTQTDLDAGSYVNTATADADETAPVTDSETVTFVQSPALAVVKSVTSSGPYAVGDTLTYDIVATNAGNITLNAVTITDSSAVVGSCTPALPAMLAPGASVTCAATHVVTQIDLDAGSYLNTATADSDETAAVTDGETVTFTQSPALAVTKTVTSSGPYAVGDTVTYDIVATNTGNITLTGVTVTDPGTGATLGACTPAIPASLAPNASVTCAAAHVVTQTDLDAGSYLNTATADSDQTAPVSDAETVTFLQSPALALTKSVTSSGPYAVGDTISYDIVATNTGNITLTSVTITDAGTDVTLGTCPAVSLAPGASLSCAATHTVTQADLDAGSFLNVASADSDQTTPVTDDETVTFTQSPALAVTKSVTSSGPYAVGDTVTYDIVATNTGNITLANVTVTDPGAGVNLDSCTPAIPASLAPGASVTCAANHVVTQTDLDNGSYLNTATADSDQTSPVTDDETVTFAQSPALAVVKSATSSGPYAVGDTLTYDIVATNTGNITLSGVSVTDPGTGAVLGSCTPALPATLAPGAAVTCAATHVVTQTDLDNGSYLNTATADSDQTSPVSDAETVTFTQSPALSVTKSVTSTGPYGVGDTISYDILATNTGNITLQNVTVTDPGTGAVLGACTPAIPATLAPNASITCAATHVVTQTDLDNGSYLNTATVDSDQTAPVSDDETVTFVQSPALVVTKSVTSSGPYAVGDTISYDIVARNTGNITLSAVTISDASAILGTCTPALPASLAPNASLTCAATHVVTQTDVDAGSYLNTATADSDQTSPVTDDETVTFTQSPALVVTKSVTSTGPYAVGDTVTYDIVATNTGNITLAGVTITDAGTDVTLGACTPAIPASLAPAASVTCAAAHTVTQADLDAGSFLNVASADSDQTAAVTDDETVTFTQSPALAVTKSVTSSGPYAVGDTLTYDIVATNTGNITLSNVTVTDPGTGATLGACTPAIPATLAPNASVTCAATHVVTQTDLDAGSYANTATADSDRTTPVTDAETVIFVQSPALAVVKTATSSGPYAVGDTLTYEITATNTGNITLHNVAVTDPGTGAVLGACTPAIPATLAPTATVTCAAAHVVTQGDLDAGSYLNTATADSDETTPVTDDETVTFVQSPALAVVKTATSSGPYAVGDTLTYDITATNTGNITLHNVTVTDPGTGAVLGACTPAAPATLAPNASLTCAATHVVTQNDLDAGSYLNTATADSDETASISDDETVTFVQSPALAVTKSVTSSGPYAVGDTLTYDIVATNTGNITLANVTITDPGTGATLGACTPAIPATLAPNASVTCAATHVVTQTDLDNGSYLNTATATSDQTSPVSAAETVTFVQSPAMTVLKSVTSTGPYAVGDTISYDIVATNAGNITLNNVVISDSSAVLGTCTPALPASLAPGASVTCEATHVVTLANINAGSYLNTASADSDQTTPVTDDETVTFTQSPQITLLKTGTLDLAVVAPDTAANVGDVIQYAFTVTNTGNVTLTDITLADTIGGVTISGGPLAALDPGQSDTTTFTGTYTLTLTDLNAGTFTNTATVTGTPPSGSPVTGADDDTQTLTAAAAISLVKTGTLHMDIVAPNSEVNPGDTITYTFTVTNTGNVTLTNITLADTIGGVTISGGPLAALDPGQSDTTTFTGTYTVVQADIDTGTFTNTATVTGTPPSGGPVSGPDEHIQTLPAAPALGVAKRLVGDPVEMTPGVYEVTYEILVRNYGNLPISDLQVTDDLTDTFPAPSLFSVVSLVSPTFTVNPAFNGAADTDLLSGADSLTVGASGSITLVVQVTPAAGGPFDNTATASGETPSAVSVTDDSQNGTDPDPDGDGNPGNNNTPTPVSFGPNLFDPPFGVKSVDVRRLPIMRWTVIWINTSNVVAVNAVSSDDIPTGTTFVDDGIPSGYPLPPGAHPTGTTTNGVACVDSSPDTTTTYCYYEGPSVDHPLGRVIWQGTLGPDFGITDPAVADDDIAIRFATRKANGVEAVDNTAVMNSDRNGDGDTDDPGETRTASASASWRLPVSLPEELPATGFAPGKVTLLPQQPAGLEYQGLEDLKLEIAALKLNTSIVGVPLAKSGWQVSWLGNQVGYLEGTAFPTWSGNSVLTAHVYDANGKPGPFVNLNTLKYGDTIVITAYGQKYVYEVRSVRTQVDPETDVITHEERPWLTLITCQGYDEKSDSYRWRTVVRAVLVKVE